jgi:hypothetical protein
MNARSWSRPLEYHDKISEVLCPNGGADSGQDPNPLIVVRQANDECLQIAVRCTMFVSGCCM